MIKSRPIADLAEMGFHSITAITKAPIRTLLRIPTPREASRQLLAALDIPWPEVLPCRNIRVVTRKKLPDPRKA